MKTDSNNYPPHPPTNAIHFTPSAAIGAERPGDETPVEAHKGLEMRQNYKGKIPCSPITAVSLWPTTSKQLDVPDLQNDFDHVQK